MTETETECCVCGTEIEHGEPSYSFGVVDAPVEGTGEWVNAGRTAFGMPVVDWTGEYESFHYVECHDCFTNED